MDVTLRAATPYDAPECGRIMYEAFLSIATHHNFPPDFPSADIARDFMSVLIARPGISGVVAERGRTVVGSIFVDQRSPVFGVGPVTVDPSAQNAGVGRLMMRDALERARAQDASGVRLLQSAYHNRSLGLYTRLGLKTREPVSVLQGPPLKVSWPDYAVRPAQPADLPACDALCRDVHGFDRSRELRDAIENNTATVVEHVGEISGYSTFVGFPGHSVARTNRDLMALIAAAPEFFGPGLLLPTRNHEVLVWCLAAGLRLVMPMTLMTIGLYNEPQGAYMPSVAY